MAELSPEEWKKKVSGHSWGRLDQRWAADEDRYMMKEYAWPTDTGRIVTSRDCVTLNDARTFADRVKDTLTLSDQIIEITEGLNEKVVDKVSSPIETWLRINLELADARLNRAEMLPLRAATSGHLVVRGRSCRRVLALRKGDQYVPDIQWYDPRYVKYATGKNGLRWCAPEMERSAEEIEEEYGVSISGSTATITDIWTPMNEYVFLGTELIKTWPHKLGYVPFICQLVPTGGFIQTSSSYEESRGESVYAPVRDLYDVLNKLLTIEMTMSRLNIEGAYQFEAQDPKGAKKTYGGDYPIEPGKVTFVEKGGGYKLIEVPDISAAIQHIISLIEVRIQRATLPFLDYGQTPFELSGSAMLMVKGAGDIIYTPRLVAQEWMDAATANMLIDQCKKGGLNADLAESPFNSKWEDRNELDGDYTIKFKYVPKLPEKELANFQRAKMAQELGVSTDTIFRHYLQMQDPDGEAKRRYLQRASDELPPIWMMEAAKAAIAEEENEMAEIIAATLDMTIEQLLSGQPQGAPQIQQQAQDQGGAMFGRSADIAPPQLPEPAGNTVI